MNITVKDGKKRHGNCVPFIVMNVKKGHIVYRGSLLEVSAQLKITSGYATSLHKSGKLFKKTYLIKRVGFSDSINFA